MMMQKWAATKTDSVQFEGFNLKNKIDRQYPQCPTTYSFTLNRSGERD